MMLALTLRSTFQHFHVARAGARAAAAAASRRQCGPCRPSTTRVPCYEGKRRSSTGPGVQAPAPLAPQEPFLNGTSATYVEEMYNAWRTDARSVHASWDAFFRRSDKNLPPGAAYQAPPDLAALGASYAASGHREEATREQASASASASSGEVQVSNDLEAHLAVMNIIRSYQMRGHLLADLDPLGISYGHLTDAEVAAGASGKPTGLSSSTVLRQHRIPADSEQDWERHYALPSNTFIGGAERTLPLRDIILRLERAYCHKVGAEYMHINDINVVQWIRERMESPGRRYALDRVQKTRLLKRLIRANTFENFLAKKWPGEKRFGLEGAEVLIPCVKQIIDRSSVAGCGTFVVGMAHRGRLNVIANVCRKPLTQIFTQFHGLEQEDPGSGDVKYHLGTRTVVKNRVSGKETTLCVVANPSHLEVVAPVVQGRVRAEQFYQGDTDGTKSVSIHIHGDAAFAGEGVVYETINLSNLPCYTTKGAIHIIVNNQIGFTTDPRFSRSSPYCTDVGRVVNAPIFHVNADDPEAVMFVADLAVDYRFRFGGDVVIDVVGYRRLGHNEADEPAFTQPRMYEIIRAKQPVQDMYAKQLVDSKVVEEAWVTQYRDQYAKICEDEFNQAKEVQKSRLTDWLDAPWKGFFKNKDLSQCPPTGVKESVMEKIGVAVSSRPPGDFVVHPGIDRILKARMKMVSDREVDWALGEAMAFGSLLLEGIHVRLSGQDVERGTFSHRHHVLHHQKKDMDTFVPLQNLLPDGGQAQAVYTVCNSSLCELGVLGFEMGYSMASPHSLVMWEAQFGDFVNMAQCVHDQFLSAGQDKWVRQCGLVTLLPHGLEGMGPEHSSGRPERFLQMCDDDPDVQTMPEDDCPRRAAIRQLAEINWIVANCTTPANYFHLLRRQIALPFRKPLIVFTPKSLLRHAEARSSFGDMAEDTEFQRLIPAEGDCTREPSSVQKLLVCTGKVFYDVRKAVKDAGHDSAIAITRVEQISPFPYDLMAEERNRYPNAKLVWVQEEHKNQGAWSYVKPRITVCTGVEPAYAGRPTSSAPATGSKTIYKREVEAFLQDAVAL